jgi:hypothetical protein
MALRLALLGLVVVSGIGCGQTTCDAYVHANQPAILDLSCGPTDLTNVALSGPCSTGDAGGLDSVFGPKMNSIAIASPSPGDCHVVLTFATGFTFSTDLTFVSRTFTDPPGCGTQVYAAPTESTVMVNNPSDTCVDAGP